MSNNEELLRTYASLGYGNIQVLNYEESPARAYLRFLAKSDMYIAEKTLEPGSQILIYKLVGSVADYD